MLKVWGRRSSFNLQKVMWLIGELGLPHQQIPAGGDFGLNDTPEFLAMNPHGRVPVIDDDGTVVWESHTIPPGRCARRVGAHRGALVRSGNAPHPRRNPADARPGEYRGGRAVVAGCDRDRAVAKGAQLRTARRAVFGEALSRGQSRRRCPRRAGAGGRGLPADPTIPRAHRGANPSRGA